LIADSGLHSTFWCFNPKSGDAGELVKDDWKTRDTDKYNIVKAMLGQRGGKFVGPLGENGVTRNG
jgi:endoglucanase